MTDDRLIDERLLLEKLAEKLYRRADTHSRDLAFLDGAEMHACRGSMNEANFIGRQLFDLAKDPDAIMALMQS